MRKMLVIAPEELGIDAEDVYLTADDGVTIHGFYLPGTSLERMAARAVLFLHGNAGNASHRLPIAVELMQISRRCWAQGTTTTR